MAQNENALIVGAGSGLSASLARLFTSNGIGVGLAARRTDKLDALRQETNARTYECDASRAEDVDALFANFNRDFGKPNIVVFNPSARSRGSIAELDPEEVRKALMVSCYGGFLVGRKAAQSMLADDNGGSILFTGASASTKGYALSATFAMGKFGLRGLAQSMARELAPRNIHVAHFVIDGGIRAAGGDARAADRGDDGMLDPDAIASTYLHVHQQHRSAWTWELELRPWLENF